MIQSGKKLQRISVLSIVFMFFFALVSNVIADDFPTADQIKADLTGQEIGNPSAWKFDSPSEFHEFTIKNKKVSGSSIKYEISVILKPRSGPIGSADLVVVYKKENSLWKFVNVTDNDTLKQIK